MPSQSSNQTALRSSEYEIELYFGVFTGSVVFTATVDSTPTFPTTALTVTAVSGSASDVKRGFRVTIESSGGEFKGETRIRDSGTISSTNVPIRELSKADIDVRATDVVKVYNLPVLSDKLVEDSETFDPDGLAFSNQNSVIPPLACSGGPWMGLTDEGQAYATVPFVGDTSVAVDEDSGGTLTHSWSAPTASTDTSSTSANPSFVFAVGSHLVEHVVTDSSNSATWTQRIPVRVYDRTANRPYDCLLPSGISADEENGWSTTVQVFDTITLANAPDRSLVCVFAYERINGSRQSFGSATNGRSHMKVLGYLNRDDNRGDAENTELTFEIVSLMQRLSELPGFSKVMISATSPANWNEIEGLSVKRAIIQILRRYTFLTELFDLVFNITDATYPRFYIQKSVPREQVKELADGLDARFTCDRTGHFYIHTHPALIALGSRSGITTTLTATDADIVEFQFARNHFRVIEVLEARGFTSGSDPQPMFARYPGTPGLGAQSITIERLIASSQTDLNERCGRRGAFNDSVFIDSSGIMRMAVDAEIRLPGAYDIADPAYQEFIVLNLNNTTNRRGVDLSDFRFWLRSVQVDYDQGTAITTWRLRSETNAPAGSTYVPPQEDDFNLPPVTPPELDNPGGIIIPPGIYPTLGTGRIGLVLTDGSIVLTEDFHTPAASGGPSWTSRSVTGASGTWINYSVIAATNPPQGIITTSNAIQKVANLSSTSPSASTLFNSFAASTSWRNLDIDYLNNVGLFMVVGSAYGTSVTAIVSTDGGSTWGTETTVASGPYLAPPSVAISAASGTTAYINAPGTGRNDIFRTQDSGGTWTALVNLHGGSSSASGLVNPIGAPTRLFYGRVASGGTEVYLMRGTIDSAQADITPTYSAVNYGPSYITPFTEVRFSIAVATNSNALLMVGNNAAQDKVGVFYTSNREASTPVWTTIVIPAAGVKYRRCAISADGTKGWLFGNDGSVAYADLIAGTVDDRTGNLSTTAEIIGIFGY